MTTIYLIRHAQAEGNLYRRCQGQYDSLVTPNGYRQIDALERRFRDSHFDAVYSSDLFRTMTTAGAIYRPRGLSLRTDPRLREIGTGCWEDHPWGDLLHRDARSLLSFWRCDPAWQVPGSETFPALQSRVCGAVERIASAHPGQTVAVVAHGTAIRSALAHWLCLPPDRISHVPHGDNTCVARLEYQNGKMTVCYYNDASHLPPELAQKPHKASQSDAELAEELGRASLYFRPLEPSDRQNLRLASHLSACGKQESGGGDPLTPADALPGSLLIAMRGGQPVGLLRLDIRRQTDPGVGYISALCLTPEVRGNGLGVQLIGQAVSTYRALDRQYLRLDCGAENRQARRFFEKNGFYKVGEGQNGAERFDTLEACISHPRP